VEATPKIRKGKTKNIATASAVRTIEYKLSPGKKHFASTPVLHLLANCCISIPQIIQ
jgi:hypothetical protein